MFDLIHDLVDIADDVAEATGFSDSDVGEVVDALDTLLDAIFGEND